MPSSRQVTRKAEPAHRRTKEKLDRAALAMAQMLRGEYDWIGAGYRRTPMKRNGEYHIPVKELLRVGGWSATSREPRAYFRGEYFKKRVAYHLQRLDGGFRKALAEVTDNGEALEELAKALFKSLMNDLLDEERAKRISFRDRATLYREIVSLQSSLKGDYQSRLRGPSVTNILAIMSKNMPEGEYKQIESKLNTALERSRDVIEGVLEIAEESES